VPARPRSLAVFRLSVREARREFEDQFRGLPIELVDLKNKFLATSFRYQGISRGLLYSWWRLEDARQAVKECRKWSCREVDDWLVPSMKDEKLDLW